MTALKSRSLLETTLQETNISPVVVYVSSLESIIFRFYVKLEGCRSWQFSIIWAALALHETNSKVGPGKKNRPSIPQQPTRNETSCNHEEFRAKLAGFGYLELIDGSFCFSCDV